LISFKLSPGIVSFAGTDLYTNEAIATILPTDKLVELNYWYYVFQNYFVFNSNENIYGAKLFNQRAIKNSILTLPPLPEQKAIAAFLDSETERINNIITKQTRMNELLKEKRSALITQAVTKGLSGLVSRKDAEFAQWAKPVKYKPSGVEWIGEIPEGWEEKRFCFLFSFTKGLSITKEDLIDEGIPCVNYGEIHSKFGFEVDPKKHELKCVKNDYLISNPKSLLKQGDFIFADTSEDIEGSGNFTYLNSTETTFAGYHTIITKPKANFNFRYTAYLFESAPFRTQIRSEVAGIKVYSITKTILKDTILTLPPLPEQKAIAAFLDSETAKIDTLVGKIEKQIELLNEYKQSLITHAVTGKIDVRGEV
jgi:type I restriction enzyme S subunit